MDRLLPITRWRRRPTTGIDHDTGDQHNVGCHHIGTTINIGTHRLDNDFFPASDLGTRIDNNADNNDFE